MIRSMYFSFLNGHRAILYVVLMLGISSCTSVKEKRHDNNNYQGHGIELSKDTKLRVVSYNGFFTSIFPTDNGKARTNQWLEKHNASGSDRMKGFASWAPRAHADIVAMQEIIYAEGTSSDTTPKGIEDYFSEVTGQKWYAAGDNEGRLVLSRHPILWSDKIKNARGMAALIDIPEEISQDLLLINLHLLSSKAVRRMWQARLTVRFIKDVRKGVYAEIPKDVPIMICGDFNSGVNDLPHRILMKLDEEPKDGDLKETHYVDPEPFQLKSKFKGTFGSVVWEREIGSSTYQAPIKVIDHILVPKGYMKISNSFVFNSLTLPREDLMKYGVEREDVLLVRKGLEEKIDHLPVFVDLK